MCRFCNLRAMRPAGVLAADAALAAPEHAGLRELKRRYSGEKSIDFSMIS